MSLVSEFLQKVGLIRNETQYHGNTKERVADTFETLFNLDVWFKKLDPQDPDANKIYQADGTLIDLPEGSVGGSGIQNLPTVADQAFFETANSGVYYASDNDVFSDLNFNGFVKVSEWEYDFRTIEVTGWFDNYGYFMSKYYSLNDDGNSAYSLSYLGDALTLNNFVPTSIQEQNNQNNLKFWTGTQAEYDALTTKNPTTLYIDSNSGLIGSGGSATWGANEW